MDTALIMAIVAYGIEYGPDAVSSILVAIEAEGSEINAATWEEHKKKWEDATPESYLET